MTTEHPPISVVDQAAARSHVPQRVTRSDIHSQIHGTGTFGRFNTWLAVKITTAVGSMWTAYLFSLLALVSLPAVLTTGGFVPTGIFPKWLLSVGLIALVAWIAQTFLQLVLLPIIIVGQNVISASQDARANADHKTLTALH
ncbi:MAG TPA: hypothetical protein VG015_01740, partial [Candidatus Dormibacteraeota bacterium]|nr:hypothetical protein [Candidatus Dormibacteraeota bacterium]